MHQKSTGLKVTFPEKIGGGGKLQIPILDGKVLRYLPADGTLINPY